MTDTPKQTQFSIGFDQTESYRAEDYIFAKDDLYNDTTYRHFDAVDTWQHNGVYLYGDRGCGKTHFIKHFMAQDQKRDWHYCMLNDFLTHKETILGTVDVKPLIIDNVDQAFGAEQTEEALFHLYNFYNGRDIKFILIGEDVPRDDVIRTKDLLSRLRTLPKMRLSNANDDVLNMIAFKLFSDKQLRVDTTVIDYILKRSERSIYALKSLIAIIDKTAIEQRRNITVPFVRDIVNGLNPET